MTSEDGAGGIDAHDHEGGGESVSLGTSGRQNGGGEQGVLHGITRGGVYGVSYASSIVGGVVVAVVAAGGHGAIGEVEDGGQLLIGTRRVVSCFVDAYTPRLALRIHTADDDFTANFNHEILNALTAQVVGDNINAEALGHGRAVKDDAGGVLLDMVVVKQTDVLIAHKLTEAVHLRTIGQLSVLEAKAPGIDEGSDGNVEGSTGGCADLLGEGEDGAEEAVNLNVLVAIAAADDARWIEHGETAVNTKELGFDASLQIITRLVGKMVEGAENGAFCCLVRDFILFGDNQIGGYG